MMMCLPPQGTPPPQHSSRHGQQHTQHTASTAATSRYPQGRRQYHCRRAGPTQTAYARPFSGAGPTRVPRAHVAYSAGVEAVLVGGCSIGIEWCIYVGLICFSRKARHQHMRENTALTGYRRPLPQDPR